MNSCASAAISLQPQRLSRYLAMTNGSFRDTVHYLSTVSW